ADCRIPLVLRVSRASNTKLRVHRVVARRLFRLFLVKIAPSIAVIVSSPNVLLVLFTTRHAVLVAGIATVALTAMDVDVVAVIAMTVMTGAIAGRLKSSRSSVYREMSLLGDDISLS